MAELDRAALQLCQAGLQALVEAVQEVWREAGHATGLPCHRFSLHPRFLLLCRLK